MWSVCSGCLPSAWNACTFFRQIAHLLICLTSKRSQRVHTKPPKCIFILKLTKYVVYVLICSCQQEKDFKSWIFKVLNTFKIISIFLLCRWLFWRVAGQEHRTKSNFANLKNKQLVNNNKHKRLLFRFYKPEAGRMTDHSGHERCKPKQLAILLRASAYRIQKLISRRR